MLGIACIYEFNVIENEKEGEMGRNKQSLKLLSDLIGKREKRNKEMKGKQKRERASN